MMNARSPLHGERALSFRSGEPVRRSRTMLFSTQSGPARRTGEWLAFGPFHDDYHRFSDRV